MRAPLPERDEDLTPPAERAVLIGIVASFLLVFVLALLVALWRDAFPQERTPPTTTTTTAEGVTASTYIARCDERGATGPGSPTPISADPGRIRSPGEETTSEVRDLRRPPDDRPSECRPRPPDGDSPRPPVSTVQPPHRTRERATRAAPPGGRLLATPPTSSTIQDSTPLTPASDGLDWAALRWCENRRQCQLGDCYRSAAGDRYRGAYQFDRATWRSVGGTGDPASAPPDEQDNRAHELYRRRGWQPWPICGRRL